MLILHTGCIGCFFFISEMLVVHQVNDFCYSYLLSTFNVFLLRENLDLYLFGCKKIKIKLLQIHGRSVDVLTRFTS